MQLASSDHGQRIAAWEAVADSCNGAEDDHRRSVWALVESFANRERSTEVGLALVRALEMIWLPDAASAVMTWAASPLPDVREAVARALSATAADPPGGETIDTLIALTRDPDQDVRDWATFSLGSQLEVDSQFIRDALADRLTDPHFDCMHEGLVGLARRRDARALMPTYRALKAESVGKLAVEAALHLGDPTLLPVLRALRSWWDIDPELLDRAIERCDPEWCRQRHELCREIAEAVMRRATQAAPHVVGLDVRVSRGFSDGDDWLDICYQSAAGKTVETTCTVSALVRRADGSPERAVDLVLADLVAEQPS